MPPTKKISYKKDDKGNDDFDTVHVESSQLATLLLMLESKEDDILIQALTAINNFAEKSAISKRTLAETGVCGPLIKFIKSDNPGIRSVACYTLACLLELNDVAKLMKKYEDLIPSVLLLLAPTEELDVHEYACLCLSRLAEFYLVKASIIAHNGVELLLQCLTSVSPDVQNYAIKTILLLLQDYSGQKAVRQLKGFPAVIDLLHSEFVVIQQTALLAIHQASYELASRVVLRELGLVGQLVDMIGQAELRDLHQLAAMTLSLFFNDHETITLMKTAGLMQRLIDLVLETPKDPVNSSDQQVGQGKAGASLKTGTVPGPAKVDDVKINKPGKTGQPEKKGKLTTDVVSSEASSVGRIVITTSAEVKEHVALSVAKAAKNHDNRRLLREMDVETMLGHLLSYPNERVQIAAAQSLTLMAENIASRDVIGKIGAISDLLVLIHHFRDDSMKTGPLEALNLLTENNDYNCSEVMKCNGVVILLAQLSSKDDRVIVHTLSVLNNIALSDDKYRVELLDNGLVALLSQSLSSKCLLVQSAASKTVSNFVLLKEHRLELMQGDGLSSLIAMLSNEEDSTLRYNATRALTVLLVDTEITNEMIRLGGLEMLRKVISSNVLRNSLTSSTLEQLLDNNMSAKYAITGLLCVRDKTTMSVFYDVGSTLKSTPFLLLNDYINQPLNDKRPIIFTSTCYGCDDEDVKMYEYVCELQNRFQTVPSAIDQVILLAQYVADKMGGIVENSRDLVHFSWELAISEHKYRRTSNVLPLGQISRGIHCHRAVLFKVLGDVVGVECSLVRGEGYRAWNEISLMDSDNAQEPAKSYMVDLMYKPGRLMSIDSADALNYRKL